MFPPRWYGGQDLVEAFGPGLICVTIDGVDVEEFKRSGSREPEVIYTLHVRQLKLPIKLTKTLGTQIAELLGTNETSEWCGCNISLRPKQTTIDGEDHWIVTCDIEAPQLEPAQGYKLDLIQLAAERKRRQLGGAAVSPSVSRGQYNPQAHSRPTDIPPNRRIGQHETLGMQRAAMLVELLEQGSKTWAELRTHLRDVVGLAELVDGIDPWDLPSAYAGDAWRWAKSFPPCAQGRNAAQIVRAWEQSQRAKQTLADGTVYDPATGEVIEPQNTNERSAAIATGVLAKGIDMSKLAQGIDNARKHQSEAPPDEYEPITEDDIPF